MYSTVPTTEAPLSTPLSVARTAAACPDATIVLGHMGGYFHVDEAIDVAERYGNVVLETSAMPYPDKIRTAVERIRSSSELRDQWAESDVLEEWLEVMKDLASRLS